MTSFQISEFAALCFWGRKTTEWHFTNFKSIPWFFTNKSLFLVTLILIFLCEEPFKLTKSINVQIYTLITQLLCKVSAETIVMWRFPYIKISSEAFMTSWLDKYKSSIEGVIVVWPFCGVFRVKTLEYCQDDRGVRSKNSILGLFEDLNEEKQRLLGNVGLRMTRQVKCTMLFLGSKIQNFSDHGGLFVYF